MLNSAHWVSPTKSTDESDLEWLFCLASAFQASERRSKMGIHVQKESACHCNKQFTRTQERSGQPGRRAPTLGSTNRRYARPVFCPTVPIE